MARVCLSEEREMWMGMGVKAMIEEISRLGFTSRSIKATGGQRQRVEQYEKTIYNTVRVPYRKTGGGFLDSYLAHKIEREQIQCHLQITDPFAKSLSIQTWLHQLPDCPPTTAFGDLEISGFDAIAYYRSFHYEPQYAWGIYIKKSGIQSVAEWLLEANVNDRDGNLLMLDDCLNLAYFFILFHETYHFLIDLLATKQEISNQTPYYYQYKEKYYWPCLKRNVSIIEGEPLEEALANAFALRMLCNEFGDEMFATPMNFIVMTDKIRQMMNNQPAGYRNFADYMTDSAYLRGNSLIYLKMMNSEIKQAEFGSWYVFEPSLADLAKAQVPVYILNE
jgi:hypothetical protein